MGCLEGVEPSPKAPQAHVLPLHHRHHVLNFFFVFVDEMMTVITEPDEILQGVVFTVSVFVMNTEYPFIL